MPKGEKVAVGEVLQAHEVPADQEKAEAKDLEVWHLPLKKDLSLHLHRLMASKQQGHGAQQMSTEKEAKVADSKADTQVDQEEEAEPPFLRVRRRLPWWQQAGASQEVLNLITLGVQAAWCNPIMKMRAQHKTVQEQMETREVLSDYMRAGAVTKSTLQGTKYLVPWFVIKKLESSGKEKLRLIADCRELNQFLETKHFKLDHWSSIFPLLRKDRRAVKIDLKNAYFHLELGKQLKPYVNMQVGEDVFQFQASCFGLSTLPRD